MPAIPIIAAVGTVASVASTVKGAIDAKKAAKNAASATPEQAGAVNIPALQTQAQNVALQNAQNSAFLEQQFNPGAAQLRQGSLQALMASLNPETGAALSDLISKQSGSGAGNDALLRQIQAQAGQPLGNTGFDSALTRAAVAQAQADLALGGNLPQDVRNLVARNAAAKSGTVSGGLGLGRDISARDLGLTSLDLSNRRLQNAAALGSQEAGLEQANAAMRLQGEMFGRNNLLQSQQAMSGDYFNQANLLQSIASGDFARALAAAQLGQNIAQPVSGLDPGSVANLAVGNSSALANQAQNAAALKTQAGNQLINLGAQGIGAFGSYYANKPAPAPVPTYTPPANAPSYYGGGAVGDFGFGKS